MLGRLTTNNCLLVRIYVPHLNGAVVQVNLSFLPHSLFGISRRDYLNGQNRRAERITAVLDGLFLFLERQHKDIRRGHVMDLRKIKVGPHVHGKAAFQ